jgi:hypothetical protein
MAHRTWQELSSGQRTAVVVVAAVEIALTAVAASDLIRRPQSLIRGRKALWWLGIFVQPLGAPAYLGWGRSHGPCRRGSPQ